MTETTANRGARAEAVQYFADEVNRRSGGDIDIQIFWGGAVLELKSMLPGLSYGSADIGPLLSSYHPMALKGLAIGEIPLQSPDPWIGMRAMYDLMTGEPQLQAMMRELNLVYISNFASTGIQFGCVGDARIERVEDLKGKRIRAIGNYAKVIDDLGAHLVNLTAADEYQALDSGLLDCTATYFYLIHAYRTYEVLDHVTRLDWGQLAGFVMAANLDTWNRLSPDQQAIILEAGSDMIDEQARLLIDDTETVARNIQNGSLGRTLSVSTMPSDERERFLDATRPYLERWIREVDEMGFDGAALWTRYQHLLSHYQQIRDTHGYPWQQTPGRAPGPGGS